MIPLSRALQLIPHAIASLVRAALLRDPLYDLGVPTAVRAPFGGEVVQAQMLRIVEQGKIILGGFPQTYPVVKAQIIEGTLVHSIIASDLGKRRLRPVGTLLQPETRVLVTVCAPTDCQPQAYFMDCVRWGHAIVREITLLHSQRICPALVAVRCESGQR